MKFKPKSVQVTFRMDAELYEALEAAAERTGVKSTDYIRSAIDGFVSGTRCPVCGALTLAGSRFCSSCGTALNEETTRIRAREEEIRFERMHAMLSKPAVFFAGMSDEELDVYEQEIQRLRRYMPAESQQDSAQEGKGQ